MDRAELQKRLDVMFPHGARVVVLGSQPVIAFWTARVAVLDDETIVIIPLYWDHGAQFTISKPVFAPDGSDVTFPQAYPVSDTTSLDIRLDAQFNPVGLEDQIKTELKQRNNQWLELVVADHEAGKAEQYG